MREGRRAAVVSAWWSGSLRAPAAWGSHAWGSAMEGTSGKEGWRRGRWPGTGEAEHQRLERWGRGRPPCKGEARAPVAGGLGWVGDGQAGGRGGCWRPGRREGRAPMTGFGLEKEKALVPCKNETLTLE
jgi:hypothetical protein